MREHIAKITDTFLGFEDHGIFTAILSVDYGQTSQSIGAYSLDEYHEPQRARRDPDGTTYRWVAGIINACGVDSWEKVKGRTILVLTKDEGTVYSFGKPIGIAPVPTEKGETFLFHRA